MRRTLALLVLAACSHEIEGPSPTVGTIDPGLVCNAVTTTLTLTGAGLSPLAVDALTDDPKLALPTVTVQRVSDLEGNPVNDPAITLCEATDRACTLVRWISQTEMEFDITPELGLEPGVYRITVANANGNSFTATVTIEVVGLPELTSVTPNNVCPGGADIVIEGTGFAPGATVTIGDTPAMVNTVTATTITATVEPGMDPGTYDVIVDNGGGCTDTLEDGLRITPGPAVFFVDPPVVYDQISVQATIYVSGLDADPAIVGIRPTGTDDPLQELEHSWDPAKPNRILATIPAGLAVGGWDVEVSDGACEAVLVDGFTVTDTLVIDVLGVEPTFGWTGESTAVTVTGGADQFQPTPRVYLNPDVTGPTTVASPLAAVAYVDDTRLTAIVP